MQTFAEMKRMNWSIREAVSQRGAQRPLRTEGSSAGLRTGRNGLTEGDAWVENQ